MRKISTYSNTIVKLKNKAIFFVYLRKKKPCFISQYLSITSSVRPGSLPAINGHLVATCNNTISKRNYPYKILWCSFGKNNETVRWSKHTENFKRSNLSPTSLCIRKMRSSSSSDIITAFHSTLVTSAKTTDKSESEIKLRTKKKFNNTW